MDNYGNYKTICIKNRIIKCSCSFILGTRQNCLLQKHGLQNLLIKQFTKKPMVLSTGGEDPQEGNIHIDAPEIASNGATVPITISTDMENVKAISVLVEKNPRPYISTFFMNDQIESSISVRIKMRETSNIVAIVETADGKFIAKQSVKVTAGGCA